MIAAAHSMVMVVAETFCFLGREEEGGGGASYGRGGHGRVGGRSRSRGEGGPTGVGGGGPADTGPSVE